MAEEERESGGSEIDLPPISAIPGLARIAVGAWWQGASWGVGTALDATRRVAEAAVSGESANELIEEVREETVANLRRMLGVVDGSPAPDTMTEAFHALIDEDPDTDERRSRVRTLRERGADLLDRAARVDDGSEGVHPGFARIVDQLAPDEARILKLLANEGAQPLVYIHKAGPLGIGARTVARRLSLIGKEAGCLHPELVSAYLDNLIRLGLVAIRRDPIPDEQTYQVIEAQPEVVEAMEGVDGGPFFSAQSSRRAVVITEFGKTFCRVCFPPEHLTGAVQPVDVHPADEIRPPELEAEESG